MQEAKVFGIRKASLQRMRKMLTLAELKSWLTHTHPTGAAECNNR